MLLSVHINYEFEHEAIIHGILILGVMLMLHHYRIYVLNAKKAPTRGTPLQSSKKIARPNFPQKHPTSMAQNE